MSVKSFLFVFLVFSGSALAQSNYAVLVGSVSDPQHHAISGAEVRVTAASTQAERRVVSNSQGFFEIPGLLPDQYSLKVSAAGFADRTETLQLEVGQRLTVNVGLVLPAVAQTVEVADLPETLHSTDAAVGEVIEPAAIKDLPLNGRMLIDLVLTVPGAHVSHGAQTGDMNPLYWRPGQRSAVSIGGNRPNANYFLLDGTTDTDPTFNTLEPEPIARCCAEFQVQTGSYSAEMGGAGGGQSQYRHALRIEPVSRHRLRIPTQWRHGRAFVQRRWATIISSRIISELPLAVRSFATEPSSSSTMKACGMPWPTRWLQPSPRLEEMSGDFSMSGTTIYNPFSAHPNPTFDPTKPISPTNPQIIRDPFPGNVIPADAINPATARPDYPAVQQFMMNYVPVPNVAWEWA